MSARRLGLLPAALLASVAAASEPPRPASPPTPAAPPSSLPLRLKTTLVADGFDFPLHLASPPGDARRLFVVERPGRIFLIKDGVRGTTPFLDISPLTGRGHEWGLYSVAFHPGYAENRRYFVYYLDNNADSRLAEFRAAPDGDTSEPMPVRLILAIPQAPHSLHYGGMIAFGPDGYLYVGMGDGQTGRRPHSPAREPDSLLGKMLRLDVDHPAPGRPYSIPPDNPFVGRPGHREEIFMMGLRNPWRWGFDRQTGDMWIADVGEDEREEITKVSRDAQKGADLGWPVLEGTLCFRPRQGCDRTGLLLPVFEYDHKEGCSVTGGHVYRGAAIPELRGTYFYSDYCSGWFRSFRLDAAGRPAEHRTWEDFPKQDNCASFGEDARGEIYLLLVSGKVLRIDRDDAAGAAP